MLMFIDIETIAQKELPPIESVKVPANVTKSETIMRYQIDGQMDQWKKQALNSLEGRICCIGYAFEDGPVTTFCCEDESRVMSDFAAFINEMREAYNEPVTFCGWNIATFDLVWLWRKAIQYNYENLKRSIPKDNRNLYVDLMRLFAADFKDYVSLCACAKFLGIPHEGCDGSEVHDFWQAGQYSKIAEHCIRDIDTTREIYKRIA